MGWVAGLTVYGLPKTTTRSSAIAEGPRDAVSQLKSFQLLHNFTKNCIRNGLQ